MARANVAYLESEMYKQLTDSLQKYLYDSQNLVKLLKGANATYKKEIAVDGELIVTQDAQISSLTKSNNKLKIQRFFFLGIGAAVAVLLIR